MTFVCACRWRKATAADVAQCNANDITFDLHRSISAAIAFTGWNRYTRRAHYRSKSSNRQQKNSNKMHFVSTFSLSFHCVSLCFGISLSFEWQRIVRKIMTNNCIKNNRIECHWWNTRNGYRITILYVTVPLHSILNISFYQIQINHIGFIVWKQFPNSFLMNTRISVDIWESITHLPKNKILPHFVQPTSDKINCLWR